MATIHLTRGAPKSARLDMAGIRKRAATKGDLVVEVKPGEEVVSVNVGWTVEKFVEEQKEVKSKKAVKVKASANGKVKAAPAKKGAGKKAAPKGKKAPAKKVSKPGKKKAKGKK